MLKGAGSLLFIGKGKESGKPAVLMAHFDVVQEEEKGLMNLEFSIASGGDFASAPAPHTPIGKLSVLHFALPVSE